MDSQRFQVLVKNSRPRSIAVVLAGLLLAGLFGSAQAAEILIGQIAPLTGMEATQGRAYAAGLRLYFDEINRSGGINGDTVTLKSEDDAGRPEETVTLAKALVAEPKVLALTGVVGSRNLAALISSGVLQDSGTPLVGYRSAELSPKEPLVYNVRASLTDEVSRIVQHVSTVGIRSLGILYEDGTGSAALLHALDQIAANAGAQIVARAAYEPERPAMTAAVDTFMASRPQAIVMVASGAATAAFIEDYRQAHGSAQLFATSTADIEQLEKRLSEEQLQGVSIAQVTPNPYTIRTRLAKEFADLVAKSPEFRSQVSYAMLEGYIAAKVLVQALRQHKPATRRSVVAALDSMNRFDVGDYLISYTPSSRSGSRRVELTIVSASGKIRQ
jgi:ABC-type branched-subunit amino acid transport system substrate-binding protein